MYLFQNDGSFFNYTFRCEFKSQVKTYPRYITPKLVAIMEGISLKIQESKILND